MRNHTAAQSVRYSPHQVFSRPMIGSTGMRNHSSAQCVTSELFERIHERIQTDEKQFRCSKCVKEFKQSGDLQRHEMIHFDEKPISCSKCDKTFTQGGI